MRDVIHFPFGYLVREEEERERERGGGVWEGREDGKKARDEVGVSEEGEEV